MRKLILWALLLSLCVSPSVCAESGDAAAFSAAIEALRQVDSRERVERARQAFYGIAGSDDRADRFRLYADILIDLSDGHLDAASAKLCGLEDAQDFSELCRSYDLPACDAIRQYIDAQRLEECGRLGDAYDLYADIGILDAAGRREALKAYSKAAQDYQSAMSAFSDGRYDEASAAFEALGDYGDSAAMAAEARARSADYAMNVAWRSVDWSANPSKYMLVAVGSRTSDGDMTGLTAWLWDAWAIPCVAVRAAGGDPGPTLRPLIEGDSDVTGVLACGFDWRDCADVIGRCTGLELPIWFSAQTSLEALERELEAQFKPVYGGAG